MSTKGTQPYIYTCIHSPQTPLPSRLPHNIEQSSPCYTVGPCWLSILNTAVCTCWSKLPNYPFPPFFPLATISSFFKSLNLFLFCKSYQIRSVAQSCPTLCNPMNHSMPGLPVHHQLPEFTQAHVHRVSDAIQPSHPLSSPSPPAPNPSQHQILFQWVNSSHEVAKVLEFQL